ncbi:MAG: hypothetical protein AAFO07_33130, partial [Bacteroidota bacterium]
FLFWKRNRMGWILMSAFFVYKIVNSIGVLYLTWKWDKDDEYLNDYSPGDFQIEIQEIESLFSQPNPMIYLTIVAMFGASLWVIFKEDLRNEFKVDVKSSWITVGVSIIVTLIIVGLV